MLHSFYAVALTCYVLTVMEAFDHPFHSCSWFVHLFDLKLSSHAYCAIYSRLYSMLCAQYCWARYRGMFFIWGRIRL